MKNRVFVFVMLAAVMAGLVSCNSNKQPTRYRVTLEALSGAEKTVSLVAETPVALWDDGLALQEARIVSEGEDGGCAIVRTDNSNLSGIAHFVYPATAVAEAEQVVLDTLQQFLPLGGGMVYYGETAADTSDNVVLKAVCGVARLCLTTTERLAKVTISTNDSNGYMAGRFSVTNYPFPILAAMEESARSVTVTGLEDIDFAQGAEVCFYVAPSCYQTFVVVMTTPDGRSCTKTLKDGKEVMIERNSVCNITLGTEALPLVFE